MNDVYVSPSGSDTNGDGTQANPYQTIGKGLSEVNAGGTVHLADGTYNQPNDRGLIVNKDVTIVGQSQVGTIIDAGSLNRIFTINPGVTVTLQNLTLENGNAATGGAINNQGDLTVNDCTFTDNTATFVGGAIVNQGDLTVNGCTFTNNNAFNGGAINNQPGGTLTVENSIFDGNTSPVGGAIVNWESMTVTGSIFDSNTAADGGAIYNVLGSTLTVTDSTFTGNTAGFDGGAILNQGDLTVNGCTFDSNTAAGGGAIFNEATLNVTDSTFTGNHADFGGAIANVVGSTLTVTDSNFTGNNAGSDGGAILNLESLTVTGSNFENNTASVGGAIWDNGDAEVHFNRIVGNSPSNSEIFSTFGTVDATLNWWGSNTSPAGKISTASGGTVLFDPWLVLTVTADPMTIFNGSTSQVTADLQHDSNGVYHDPALGHVPDGIPITLTTDWGSFTNPEITHSITLGTVNGGVTATFFANEGLPIPNPVEITATADDTTVSTFITVIVPSQSQTQTQTQNSINTNTNNLTNNNVNVASSNSSAANTNNIVNANSFDPVIVLDNSNYLGNITVNSSNINGQIQAFIRRLL
jgi:predicted outer membrane repeat protein